MVQVKQGDLVKIEYTGRAKSTGRAFETTDENIARKEGIYLENTAYGPKLVVFGSGTMITGVEDAIPSLVQGEEGEFLILPERAFGKRDTELVRMVPEKEFLSKGVKPEQGMAVVLDDKLAQVKSVESGRVVVDFNHPLAGETVLYSIRVTDVLREGKEKVNAILASLEMVGITKELDSGELEVLLRKGAEPKKKEMAKNAILAAVSNAKFGEF